VSSLFVSFLLVFRKNLTKRLDLQHQGMGDKMAISLAEALKDLPFIESINIADNMLTDAGIEPMLR
jgi:Ran GTPase-activating protein (RanGAP) involved in mRNA processing and transport